jgi:hypothetical protein
MTVIPMHKPLVEGDPQMLERAGDILKRLNSEHPGARLVSFMAMQHPRTITRATMRRISNTDGQEPRFAASFEWLLMRINDTLPLTGWKITDRHERYRLERISQEHHERLVEQFHHARR